MSNDKALAAFVNIFERPVIWAAFHERSFEVGERSEVGALEGTTKKQSKKVKCTKLFIII